MFFSLCPKATRRAPPMKQFCVSSVGPTTVAGRQFTQNVYEYSDPNVGNYSPTNVVSREMRHRYCSIFGGLHLIRDNRSSFRKKSKSRLSRQAAGRCFSNAVLFAFRRKAGTTRFFLLPVQYSHCLVLSDTVKARLLPANLVQTALLFHGSIDLRIHLGYGLFRPGCRNQDLADLPELGIFNESETAPPWPQLHPYAISSAADLPRALGAVIKKLATAPR